MKRSARSHTQHLAPGKDETYNSGILEHVRPYRRDAALHHTGRGAFSLETAGLALTEKQQRFVEEYLVDLNATQAAVRAGYSEKTARSIASENLAKPDIQEAVAALKAKRAERLQITQDSVLAELAVIGFANLGDYLSVDARGVVGVDFSALGAGDLRAVAKLTQRHVPGIERDDPGSYETKIELGSKVQALKLLGDHLGLFKTAEKSMVSDLAGAMAKARARAERRDA